MPHSYCDIFALLYLCWPMKYDSTTIAVANTTSDKDVDQQRQISCEIKVRHCRAMTLKNSPCYEGG